MSDFKAKSTKIRFPLRLCPRGSLITAFPRPRKLHLRCLTSKGRVGEVKEGDGTERACIQVARRMEGPEYMTQDVVQQCCQHCCTTLLYNMMATCCQHVLVVEFGS